MEGLATFRLRVAVTLQQAATGLRQSHRMVAVARHARRSRSAPARADDAGRLSGDVGAARRRGRAGHDWRPLGRRRRWPACATRSRAGCRRGRGRWTRSRSGPRGRVDVSREHVVSSRASGAPVPRAIGILGDRAGARRRSGGRSAPPRPSDSNRRRHGRARPSPMAGRPPDRGRGSRRRVVRRRLAASSRDRLWSFRASLARVVEVSGIEIHGAPLSLERTTANSPPGFLVTNW